MTYHDPRDVERVTVQGPEPVVAHRQPSRWPLYLAVLIVVAAAVFVAQVAASQRGSEPPSTAPALSGALHIASRPVSTRSRSAPLHIAGLLTVRGKASWYCSSTSRCTRGYPASGLFAAAGPALRTGDWRGRTVRVCLVGQRGDCITVRLVDWCACPGRVIDLYRSAFSQLASPSRGVLHVSVEAASLSLPPTDTEVTR